MLLDYHNDVNPYKKEITSFNWVGKLIENETIDCVYWVCLFSITDEQRMEKQRWLLTNCAEKTDVMVQKIQNAFNIMSFEEFEKQKLTEKYTVTLDLDLVTLDTAAPSLFTKKICDRLKVINPELLTVCFSASYQTEPGKAFSALRDFLMNYDVQSDWLFKSGEYEEMNESREDIRAWDEWKMHPGKFERYGEALYRGAYLWVNISRDIADMLCERGVRSYREDRVTNEVIFGWKDKKRLELKEKFSIKEFIKYENICAGEIKSFLNQTGENIEKHTTDVGSMGEATVEGVQADEVLETTVPSDKTPAYGFTLCIHSETKEYGKETFFSDEKLTGLEEKFKISVRKILSGSLFDGGSDNNLYITISVFSDFCKIERWDDFVPALASLCIKNGKKEIQVYSCEPAFKKNYSKDTYIQYVLNKSGLRMDAIKFGEIEIYRCNTIFDTAPVF